MSVPYSSVFDHVNLRPPRLTRRAPTRHQPVMASFLPSTDESDEDKAVADHPATEVAMSPTDAELVRRIRLGDDRALEEIFRRYYAGMCFFVRRFVHAPDVAEELVQDVFFKLWSKRESLNDIDATKTYLYRAARNTALNHLRRRKLEQSWEEKEAQRGEPQSLGGTDDATSSDEVRRAVVAAIEKLPARCGEIFLLSRDGGLTYGEIASTLGISIKTVETQMGRALKSLRLSLAKFRA